MAKFADRVKVTVDSSTSGTGAVTLSTAVSGYQVVPSALDGASIRYVIELGTAWEIGLGVYTHSTLELTRSLTSSSTGSLLSLNNTAVVFISPAAEDLQYVEVYSSTSDLPSASSNHGRIAHVHGDGAMYFAHGGNWVRLGNHSDITSYTLPTASSSTLGGIKIGSGLSIDGSGVVTASGSSGIALTDLSVTQNSASGSGALSYDNTSGVFSYTPPASSGSSSTGGSLVPITTTKTVVSSAGQTVFTGSWKADNIAVFLNGVKLQDSEVTATDTQITISATAVGDVVEVVEYGAPFASPYASTFPTVTTGATSVTVDYTADKVAVYKNGVKLRGGGVDFTATNGTSITGFSAFVANDVVEVVEHGSLASTPNNIVDLSDTPSSLGTAGQVLQVNSGANALEFATPSSGVSTIGSLDFSPSAINETSTITTSSNMSNAPFISAFKEIPQTGISTKGNWDVNSTASNYDLLDEAPLLYSGVNITPSSATANGTFTLSSGSFASGDVGKTVEGNSGKAIITATSGTYSLVTAFANTNAITSGSWALYGIAPKTDGSGLELSNISDAYNVSSGTYVQTSTYTPFRQFTLQFNGDGTEVSTAMYSSAWVIDTYTLTTAWDITTIGSSRTRRSSGLQGDYTVFNGDGTRALNYNSGVHATLKEYSLNSYDVTTMSSVGTATLSGGQHNNFFIKPDTYNTFYATIGNILYKYTFTGGSPVTGTLTQDSGTLTLTSNGTYVNGNSLAFKPDGSEFYIVNSAIPAIETWELTTEWDITTASVKSGTLSVGDDGAIYLKPDGTRIYHLDDSDSHKIDEYDIGTGIFVPTSQYLIATTNSGGQIDTESWTDLNSLTADETLNDGATYYAFSTDGRTTWKVQDSSGNLRSIAKLNSSTWQYNNNATFGSETWVNATNNNQQSALQQALGAQSANRLTGTDLATYSDANLLATGDTFDLMIGLYMGSAGTSPASDAITISYDGAVQNKGAILGTDYDVEKLSDTQLKFTALTQKNMHFKVI